jgi:hypothetical protein
MERATERLATMLLRHRVAVLVVWAAVCLGRVCQIGEGFWATMLAWCAAV